MPYKNNDSLSEPESHFFSTLRVKVSSLDFNAAKSNGWVDGLYQGKQGLYVYIELGRELDYTPRPKDDSKTEYRLFEGCTVFFATSQEQLDKGVCQLKKNNLKVVIYC